MKGLWPVEGDPKKLSNNRTTILKKLEAWFHLAELEPTQSPIVFIIDV